MPTITNIFKALNTRLINMPSRPPIAWQNIKYTPQGNLVYLRPTLLPQQTLQSTLDGVQEHSGIYQVDIYVPLDKGTMTFSTLADQITDYFRAQKTLIADGDRVFIQNVGIGEPVRQDAWYVGYVEINYICFS